MIRFLFLSQVHQAIKEGPLEFTMICRVASLVSVSLAPLD
jgi:hypothetical protein